MANWVEESLKFQTILVYAFGGLEFLVNDRKERGVVYGKNTSRI